MRRGEGVAKIRSRQKYIAMTAALRREMWNELADQVSLAAALLTRHGPHIGTDQLEALHNELLWIALMMRRGGVGHPSSGRTQRGVSAAERTADRVIARRSEWLTKHNRRNAPDRELDRWINEESDRELAQTNIRPLAAAVRGVLKRGGRRGPTSRKGGHTHLQEAQRIFEQIWLTVREEDLSRKNPSD